MASERESGLLERKWACRYEGRSRLKGAVLAAGLGSRLDPLTARHLPKPLFPLGGKVPIAEIWTRRLVDSGVTDLSMNVCVMAEAIKGHFGAGGPEHMAPEFIDEKTPSGTLGGICKQGLGRDAKWSDDGNDRVSLTPFTGSTIIAPSADIVCNFGPELLEQMHDIHRKVGAALTIVVVPVPMDRRKDFGTVVLDDGVGGAGPITRSGRVTAFAEKDPESPSNLSNASIYMIEMDLLRELDKLRTAVSLNDDEPFYDFGRHVFPALLGSLPYLRLPRDYPLWAVQYDGGWFDVGTKQDYLLVNQSLLDGDVDVTLPYQQTSWGFLGANVDIDLSRVEIRPPVVIGNDCVIEPGAVLGPYAVLGDGWRVERGARIERSVFWERYPFFTVSGQMIPVADRLDLDPHVVRRDVSVSGSIVVAGCLDRTIDAKTVEVREEGELVVLPIDCIPQGPRP